MDKQVEMLHQDPMSPLYWFCELSQIPRASYHEEKVAAWLMDFAKEKGFFAATDKDRNVFIRMPATPGYEHVPPVLLQGHTDMVAEKNADCDHNFDTDPLDLYIEDGYLRARGTTLGADDGIAVAVMLAVLNGAIEPHPAVECLFTASEEVGLDGAKGFDTSLITAHRMINMDSTSLSEIITGCCGGIRSDLTFRPEREDYPDSVPVRLFLSGLCGGHSGEDINKGRRNANRVSGRMLATLLETVPYRLISVRGGSKDNAIPRECEAVVAVKKKDLEAFTACFERERDEIFRILRGPDCSAKWECALLPGCSLKPMGQTWTRNLVFLLSTVQNGVFSMDPDIPTLVGFSRNLGVIRTEGDTVDLVFSTRSAYDSQLAASTRQLDQYAAVLGATARHYAKYPGWVADPESAVRKLWSEAYSRVSGGSIEPLVIHAGLECGLLFEKRPDLDIISVGPNLYDIHSPGEKMELRSVEVFWKTLKTVFRMICAQEGASDA
ncbi:MAG: beta-Ala-His dipeptidase [Clostridia bacterium]|nr:beta-Ala-His dipeptidase [Clostridia bacterium]